MQEDYFETCAPRVKSHQSGDGVHTSSELVATNVDAANVPKEITKTLIYIYCLRLFSGCKKKKFAIEKIFCRYFLLFEIINIFVNSFFVIFMDRAVFKTLHWLAYKIFVMLMGIPKLQAKYQALGNLSFGTFRMFIHRKKLRVFRTFRSIGTLACRL